MDDINNCIVEFTICDFAIFLNFLTMNVPLRLELCNPEIKHKMIIIRIKLVVKTVHIDGFFLLHKYKQGAD
jgi:hypothetical protein